MRSSRTLGDKALSERARYLDIIREIAGPLPVDRAKTKDLQDLVMGRWGADAESGKDAAPTAQKKAVGVLEVLFDFASTGADRKEPGERALARRNPRQRRPADLGGRGALPPIRAGHCRGQPRTPRLRARQVRLHPEGRPHPVDVARPQNGHQPGHG